MNEKNYTLENISDSSIIESNETNTFTLIEEDFIIKNKNTYIKFKGNYENLITNKKILNIIYLDEDTLYDTYFYENLTIGVSPPDNMIFFIDLIDPSIETYRGISIGNSVLDVKSKYGLPDKEYMNTYTYNFNYESITFYFNEEEKVIRITFSTT